jgi:hypothetical protein
VLPLLLQATGGLRESGRRPSGDTGVSPPVELPQIPAVSEV